VAACFYSLVETCKLVEVSPTEYLTEAARRAIAEPGAVTLPHEFTNERRRRPAAAGSGGVRLSRRGLADLYDQDPRTRPLGVDNIQLSTLRSARSERPDHPS